MTTLKIKQVIQPTAEILKEIKLLQCFSDSELTQLISMGKVSSFEPHASVVIEGELTWGLYLILDGVVGIFKNNKLTGDVYDIGQLAAGNFFGEMSLVDESPRSATVRALTDCHLFYVSKEVFHQFLATSGDIKLRFYQSCVRSLVHRLRELDDNYVVSQYQLWKTALRKEAA